MECRERANNPARAPNHVAQTVQLSTAPTAHLILGRTHAIPQTNENMMAEQTARVRFRRERQLPGNGTVTRVGSRTLRSRHG
eukprot:11569455-Alexandrium_andersonii.AAC.1